MIKQTKLKAILEDRGITPYRLSKDTGIASNMIYNIINGKVFIYAGWKERISNYLELPPESVFIEEEEH